MFSVQGTRVRFSPAPYFKGNKMDTIDTLYKMLDEGNFTQKEEHELQNDGIGSYEYWGYKGFDSGDDYIAGSVILNFDIKKPDEELLKEFCKLETEVFPFCEFYGEDPEIEEIQYEIKEKSVDLIVIYTSYPYYR